MATCVEKMDPKDRADLLEVMENQADTMALVASLKGMGLCRYCALHFAISIVTKVFLREMEEVADVSEIMALASGAASYGYVAGMIERGKIQEEIAKHKSAAGAAPSVNPVQGPAEEARGASETDLRKPMKGRVN